MYFCHTQSVQLIEEILQKFVSLDYSRVLEVAAGDGKLSRDLLSKKFYAVDCFD